METTHFLVRVLGITATVLGAIGCAQAQSPAGPFIYAEGVSTPLLIPQHFILDPLGTGGNTNQRLPDDGRNLRWTTNGDWIAYNIVKDGLVDQAGLSIARSDGSETIVVAEVGAGASVAAWSPDGQSIAYATRHAASLLIEPVHCRVNGLTCVDAEPSELAVPGRFPSWSYDGLMLAYEHQGSIRIFRFEDNSDSAVVLPYKFCQKPVWAPSTNQLALGCANDQTRLIVIATFDLSGQVSLSELEFEGFCFSPTWSPSGEAIAMICSEIDGLGEKLGIGDSATATNSVYVVDSTFQEIPKRVLSSEFTDVGWITWFSVLGNSGNEDN